MYEDKEPISVIDFNQILRYLKVFILKEQKLSVLTASIRRPVILLDVGVSICCFMRNTKGNRLNSATYLHTSQPTTWIPNIVFRSWSCLCSASSVKIRGDCWFSCYWWCWWPSLFKLPFFIINITLKMYVDRFLCCHAFVAKINRSILSR